MSHKTFSIIGVTLFGNMGGQAMLRATVQELESKYPGSKYILHSIYFKKDLEINFIKNLKIRPCNALILTFIYLPLAILLYPFKNIPGLNKLITLIPFFKILSNSDAHINLGGITFIDGRGIVLLLYNMACSLPAMTVNTPVYKLSQAMGPFKNALNNFFAKFIIKRTAATVARGEITFDNLKDLHLTQPNIHLCYDTAFSCKITDPEMQEAKGLLNDIGFTDEFIIISPSRVVQRICTEKGINFKKEMADFISYLVSKDFKVLLLPHSLGTGTSKNNDVDICSELADEENSQNVKMISSTQNANTLRAIISHADLFIGCRFHSIVAALSMSVPTIVIGWSHKYLEMVKPFDQEKWVFDNKDLTTELLKTQFDSLYAQKKETKEILKARLDNVIKSSNKNFNLIFDTLKEN